MKEKTAIDLARAMIEALRDMQCDDSVKIICASVGCDNKITIQLSAGIEAVSSSYRIPVLDEGIENGYRYRAIRHNNIVILQLDKTTE